MPDTSPPDATPDPAEGSTPDLSPDGLVARNRAYAEAFTAGHLSAPPRLGLAVLTCIDARLLPHRFLALDIGDAKVVRNAGGRATPDAIRSLVVATRLLGVRRIAVVHHTDCGNAGTDEELAEKLRSAGVEDVPSPLFANTGGEAAVAEDVARLRGEPGLAQGTVVDGYVYDVATGRLHAV